MHIYIFMSKFRLSTNFLVIKVLVENKLCSFHYQIKFLLSNFLVAQKISSLQNFCYQIYIQQQGDCFLFATKLYSRKKKKKKAGKYFCYQDFSRKCFRFFKRKITCSRKSFFYYKIVLVANNLWTIQILLLASLSFATKLTFSSR